MNIGGVVGGDVCVGDDVRVYVCVYIDGIVGDNVGECDGIDVVVGVCDVIGVGVGGDIGVGVCFGIGVGVGIGVVVPSDGVLRCVLWCW